MGTRDRKGRLRSWMPFTLIGATLLTAGALYGLLAGWPSSDSGQHLLDREAVADGISELEKEGFPPTVAELLAKKRASGVTYAEARAISASGTGKITDNTAQGRLLARRAALTDARRNLLIAVQKIHPGNSGRLGPHGIRREWIEGDLYRMEVDMWLD